MKKLFPLLSLFIFMSAVFNPAFLAAAGRKEAAGPPAAPGQDIQARDERSIEDYAVYPLEVKYAENFQIEYLEGAALITVTVPGRTALSYQYIIVPGGKELPAAFPKSSFPRATVVSVPLQSSVTLSTTFVAFIEILDRLDTIIGHDSRLHLTNEYLAERIRSNKVLEVGNGPSLNLELLVALDPDAVLSSGGGGEWDISPKIAEAGLNTLVVNDFLETNPLGRAEWVKFFGLLYGREEAADLYFRDVEERYRTLAARVGESLKETGRPRPFVVMNNPVGGSWFMPGGEGYMAAFLRDAGADYLWSDIRGSGSVMLDMEIVYERALDADFWIHLFGVKSKKDIEAGDPRFTDFRAYQEGNLVNNDVRENESGGNDFYGSGSARPDVILMDLVSVFHPSLVPGHEPYYYRFVK